MTYARAAVFSLWLLAAALFVPLFVFAQSTTQCQGGARKINCAVNGAINYVCPEKCPAQQNQSVQEAGKTSTAQDKSIEKATECDKVNLSGAQGGIRTCWKAGIRGGASEPACVVKGPTCQSFLQEAQKALESGTPNVSGSGTQSDPNTLPPNSASQDYLDNLNKAFGDLPPEQKTGLEPGSECCADLEARINEFKSLLEPGKPPFELKVPPINPALLEFDGYKPVFSSTDPIGKFFNGGVLRLTPPPATPPLGMASRAFTARFRIAVSS